MPKNQEKLSLEALELTAEEAARVVGGTTIVRAPSRDLSLVFGPRPDQSLVFGPPPDQSLALGTVRPLTDTANIDTSSIDIAAIDFAHIFSR